MKITKTVRDQNGRNALFVVDNGEVLTVTEIAAWVEKGHLPGLHTVRTKTGISIRSNRNRTSTDNLSKLASSFDVIANSKSPRDQKIFEAILAKKKAADEDRANIDESVRAVGWRKNHSEKELVSYVTRHRASIVKAAEHSRIDPNLLGGILIDEHLRMDWGDLFDWRAAIPYLGEDISVGMAQVKIKTARALIRDQLYNPKPRDPRFSPKNIDGLPSISLYQEIIVPRHSIGLAAAKIRQTINDWASDIDLSNKPDILGTLYSLFKKKHSDPESNDRGKQIAREFYPIARSGLHR